MQVKFYVYGLALILLGGWFLQDLPAYAAPQNPSAAPMETLPLGRLSVFATADKKIKQADFIVELARTPEHQRQGLMYRSELADNAGMLFIFNKPRQARFWMRNTLIPLDMIFIKSNGEIENIVTRWDTQSDRPSLSTAIVSYVLEINAGLAQKLDIKPGQFIQLSTMP
ncbi:MAG: DUF192 domain-containing protein [Parvibaculales bacterium]